MLYRLRPTGQTEWISNIGRETFALVKDHGGDLDRLEWEAAERVFTLDDLRLTLRHGVPSAVGLIVDPVDLVPAERPRKLEESHASLIEFRPEFRKTLAKTELFMPGTLAAEDLSNAEVDEAIRRSIAEARRELGEALDQPARPELVVHWERLGGLVPDPL